MTRPSLISGETYAEFYGAMDDTVRHLRNLVMIIISAAGDADVRDDPDLTRIRTLGGRLEVRLDGEDYAFFDPITGRLDCHLDVLFLATQRDPIVPVANLVNDIARARAIRKGA